jgi:hypothetical protein
MKYDDTKLEEQRSMAVENLEAVESIQESLSEDDRPYSGVYIQTGLNGKTAAVHSLLLDHPATAQKYFRTMGNGWLDYVGEIARYPDEIAHDSGHKVRPKHAREGLEAAILADDEQLVQRGIDACRNLPESYPEEHEPVELYWRARAFAEVVAESDTVDELLNQYESARYDVVDDGWLDVLHGLHKSDAKRVTTGLQILLDEWAANTDSDVTDAETLLDVNTAALYVLARRRGLNVEIDHERFPEQFDDLVSV